MASDISNPITLLMVNRFLASKWVYHEFWFAFLYKKKKGKNKLQRYNSMIPKVIAYAKRYWR